MRVAMMTVMTAVMTCCQVPWGRMAVSEVQASSYLSIIRGISEALAARETAAGTGGAASSLKS